MGRPKGSWKGKANPRWNGGQYVTKEGYVFLKMSDHPNADCRGYVREHVYVMSEQLGRPLQNGEIVHHINGNSSDNRPENLIVLVRGKHISLHHTGMIKPNSLQNLRRTTSEDMKHIWATTRRHDRAAPRICDFCGKKFHGWRGKGTYTKHQFCDATCFQAWRTQQAEIKHQEPSASE